MAISDNPAIHSLKPSQPVHRPLTGLQTSSPFINQSSLQSVHNMHGVAIEYSYPVSFNPHHPTSTPPTSPRASPSSLLPPPSSTHKRIKQIALKSVSTQTPQQSYLWRSTGIHCKYSHCVVITLQQGKWRNIQQMSPHIYTRSRITIIMVVLLYIVRTLGIANLSAPL